MIRTLMKISGALGVPVIGPSKIIGAEIRSESSEQTVRSLRCTLVAFLPS